MLLAALSESLGLSLVLPLLNNLIGVEFASGPIADFTNQLLKYVPGGASLESLLLILGIAFVSKAALAVIARGMSRYFALCLREDWARQILDHYLKANATYLAAQRHGTMVHNTAEETYQAARGIIKILNFLNKSFLVIALIVVLLLANWQATLAFATVGIAIIVAMRRSTSRYAMKYGRRRLRYGQQIAAVVVDATSKVRHIKFFDAYELFRKRLSDKLRRYTRSETILQVATDIPREATDVALFALVASVLLLLKHGFNVAPQEAVPLIGFFIIVGQRLMTQIGYLASMRMKIAADVPALTLIHKLISDVPVREDLHRGVDFKGLESDIVFQDVGFEYDDGKKVFSKLNLTIPKGKTTALVGPSGVGKSTVANLLLGLYRPQDGRICLNGHSLSDFSLQSLREKIGYVAQDAEIFNATVRENILIGRPGASEAEIREAVRLSHAREFVGELHRDYDTLLGDRGVLLSGGERQRIAIARVILRRPDVYIFDEATNALDHESEQLIHDSIAQLARGATVIIIGHRSSTVSHADVIYQLNAGGRAQQVGLVDTANMVVSGGCSPVQDVSRPGPR